jgi:formylmethanofuran dehydrogenase subunit E
VHLGRHLARARVQRTRLPRPWEAVPEVRDAGSRARPMVRHGGEVVMLDWEEREMLAAAEPSEDRPPWSEASLEIGRCPDCDEPVEILYEHEVENPPLCAACFEDITVP